MFEHEAFRSGNFNTHFVKDYYSVEKMKGKTDEEAKLAAMVALKVYLEEKQVLKLPLS